jgi:hypothetical protein
MAYSRQLDEERWYIPTYGNRRRNVKVDCLAPRGTNKDYMEKNRPEVRTKPANYRQIGLELVGIGIPV